MQIEERQKYDFTKIGKYGCGDPDKYWCKSWLPFSRSRTSGRRGGDGCSLPAAHQNDRWANPNISGNSWGDGTNDLRAFRNFPPKGERRSAPPFWDRLDCTHCISSISDLYLFRPPSCQHLFVFLQFYNLYFSNFCVSPAPCLSPLCFLTYCDFLVDLFHQHLI